MILKNHPIYPVKEVFRKILSWIIWFSWYLFDLFFLSKHAYERNMVLFRLFCLFLRHFLSEFLKRAVVRSCDRAKIFWPCVKSWDLHEQAKNLCILTFFAVFYFMFHTYQVIFSDIFALFLAQNIKTKVLTAQKKWLLECLLPFPKHFVWLGIQWINKMALIKIIIVGLSPIPPCNQGPVGLSLWACVFFNENKRVKWIVLNCLPL